jgi:serine/threonine protein kinase
MFTVSLSTGDTGVNQAAESSSPAASPGPAASEPPAEAQDKIGPYVLKRKLGAGAMGEVWLAYDSNLDREMAVKILPPAFAEDHDRLRRFLREAKLAAKLDHPNTATIHYAGVEGKRAFLAMQYIDGGSLEEASPKVGHCPGVRRPARSARRRPGWRQPTSAGWSIGTSSRPT